MTLDEQSFDIGRLDRLSYQNTWVHRLDPRAKLIATLLFLMSVISFPKHEISALAPFFLFPAVFIVIGDIPLRFILKRVMVISPFVIFIGLFNPILDTRPAATIAAVPLSMGWLSFLSILLKFLLTVSAALLLLATTSFPGICHAFRKLGLPSLFVTQLLFLYRYLFVLMEEAMRMTRARDMRSFGIRGTGMHVFVQMIGTLFIRTVDRAERIYDAMLSRGFQGDIPTLKRFRLTATDLLFLMVTGGLLIIFRCLPITETIGCFVRGLFS